MKKTKFLSALALLTLVSCSGGDQPTSSQVPQSSEETSEASSMQNSETKPLNPTTLFLVGDSTVCEFNDAYYYPRYGYGTQLSNYLDKSVTVNNLAISGRSSKSFINEANYNTLKTSIKAGDYLMIGFGHNDEKNDDAARFTNPTGGIEDETSFKHYLYNYYIKIAQDAGATPILCTPVVRADTSNNYAGASGHVTSDGDYAECIRELGKEKNVTVIDLTQKTKDFYTQIGFNEAINYHAWTTKNSASVDKTHLNILGAKNVAYMFADSLKATDNTLKDYVLADIKAPTKEADLVPNPNYVEVPYESFDPSKYTPNPIFANFQTQGWYGTAFGDTGGSPTSDTNGYVAEETAPGTFRVGQTGTAAGKGKFSNSSDGYAMVFTQVPRAKNFKISVDMKVLTTLSVKQEGFGLMLRDDIYVNQASQNPAIKSNYLAAGMYANSDTAMKAIFRRENTALTAEANNINALYAVDDTAHAEIERLGQSVSLKFVYKDIEYTKTFVDFDLFAIDSNYMYVGMFANRGTTIECTNVNFEITTDAIEA